MNMEMYNIASHVSKADPILLKRYVLGFVSVYRIVSVLLLQYINMYISK